MKTVPDKCKTHPLYKAMRAPRCFCEPCWRIWIHKQDQTPEKDNPIEAYFGWKGVK
jgi:hypothetical protein